MACLAPCVHLSAKVLTAKYKFKCTFSKIVTKIQCLLIHIIQNHIRLFYTFSLELDWRREHTESALRCGPSCLSVETGNPVSR
jgi:hypothetical protein